MRLEHPVLERVGDEFRSGLQAELLLDVLPVRLDRSHREVELIRNLSVRVPESDPPQDIDLALGEVIRRPGWGLGRDPRAELRVEVDLSARGTLDGLDKLALGRLFQHVRERTGPKCLTRERRVLLHRQHDDLGVRRLATELRDRLEDGPSRHVEINDEDVRMVPAHIASRRVNIAGFGHHLEAGFSIQQQLEATPNDLVVIREDDPNRSCVSAASPRRRRFCIAHA